METHNNLIKEIDIVLKFMATNDFIKPHASDGEISAWMKKSNIEIQNLNKYLNQLTKDGFLEMELINGIANYRISWDGNFFFQVGGYEKDVEMDNQIRRAPLRMEKLQRTLTCLTGILAVSATVASVYYIIEIVNLCSN